jgi:hypothetical protein
MEQYDRNFKVQQIMGAKMDATTPSSGKMSGNNGVSNKRR